MTPVHSAAHVDHRAIARALTSAKPVDQSRVPLAWVRGKHTGPRTPSVVPVATGETPKAQSGKPSKFDRLTLMRTFALGFLRDAATTAPCYPPSLFAGAVLPPLARRRCVRPTSATRIVKDEHPCHSVPTDALQVSLRRVDELRGSRQRNPLWLVALD